MKKVKAMKKLEELSWEKVKVFDDSESFIIATTNSSVDSIRIKEGSSKIVPYISRTNNNNGISQFVSIDNYEFGSDAAGSITVGLDTQTAFYQPYRFITGQNIHVVTGKHLNKDLALFYIPILKKQMIAKFNWGGNGATLGRMKLLDALVPTDQDGVQDYKYMTEYSKEKQKRLIAKYKKYLEKKINQIEYKEIPQLKEKQWKHVLLSCVFTKIQRGKRIKKANQLNGQIPYVSSTANNNGVDNYIIASSGTRVFNNCISLANSGSVGVAFYEPFSFVASDHVTSLKRDNSSKFLYMFLITTIQKQKGNYSFNREINDSRIKRMQIMLPAKEDGEPDYEYMEQYAKNMMLKKYKQYLSFLERKEKKR